MSTIDLIAGARPNFMKVASIIHGIGSATSKLKYRLIHTGQHYDTAMSNGFFDQLNLPQPDMNFGVGSGTQAEQTAKIMLAYEKVLRESPVDACIVVGDVTSTMATAVTAKKMGVPVGHVEAGIRSNDWSMPEEVNRRITDAVSDWFFTTSEFANLNLRNEGIRAEQIFFVGNTMIDTLIRQQDFLNPPVFWNQIGLKNQSYFVLTLHRPSNVDGERKLAHTISAIGEIAGDYPVVYPIHPRSSKALGKHLKFSKNIHMVPPQNYREFNFLVKNCLAVITDSGGITEEATFMGIPCMTLRDTTERPETIEVGTNELVGTNPEDLRSHVGRLLRGEWKQGAIPARWDGRSGERIVRHLEALLS